MSLHEAVKSQPQNGVGVGSDSDRRGGGNGKNTVLGFLGGYRVLTDGDHCIMANAPETRALALLLGHTIKASRKDIVIPMPDPSAIEALARVLHRLHRKGINKEVYEYLAEIGINDPVRSALAADEWVTVNKVYAHYRRLVEIAKSQPPSLGLLINILRQHQEPPRDKFGGEITKIKWEIES